MMRWPPPERAPKPPDRRAEHLQILKMAVELQEWAGGHRPGPAAARLAGLLAETDPRTGLPRRRAAVRRLIRQAMRHAGSMLARLAEAGSAGVPASGPASQAAAGPGPEASAWYEDPEALAQLQARARAETGWRQHVQPEDG